MAYELIIGIEIALFFGFIYYLENKRYKSIVNSQKRIVINQDNIDKIPELFVADFKKRMNGFKDGSITLSVQDLMNVIDKIEYNELNHGNKSKK